MKLGLRVARLRVTLRWVPGLLEVRLLICLLPSGLLVAPIEAFLVARLVGGMVVGLWAVGVDVGLLFLVGIQW